MKAVLIAVVLCFAFAQAQLFISIKDPPGSQIKYTITNKGLEPAVILDYGTPFEANGTMFFPVVRISHPLEDVGIPYVGALARRVHPSMAQAQSHLTIPAQSTLSKIVELEGLYEIAESGVFSISARIPEFNPTLVDAQVDEPLTKFLEQSTRVQFDDRANTYTNCNSGEQSAVATAETTAQGLANNAKNCMSAGSCQDKTSKWFGSTKTVNSGYYTYDQNTVTSIYNQLSSVGINAYCNPAGCGPNVYAYVYPNDKTYTVYLCGAFWSQPSERPNTIVHEMSHFTSFGGTLDYAYGATTCINLAKTNPYQASHNADNVCYFSSDVSCGQPTCS